MAWTRSHGIALYVKCHSSSLCLSLTIMQWYSEFSWKWHLDFVVSYLIFLHRFVYSYVLPEYADKDKWMIVIDESCCWQLLISHWLDEAAIDATPDGKACGLGAWVQLPRVIHVALGVLGSYCFRISKEQASCESESERSVRTGLFFEPLLCQALGNRETEFLSLWSFSLVNYFSASIMEH